MKIFVIHRFASRKKALQVLEQIAAKNNISLSPTLIDSSHGEKWKAIAKKAIEIAEAVVIFDPNSCKGSNNIAWEIRTSEEFGKPIVEIDPENTVSEELSKLLSIYHNNEEFNSLFVSSNGDVSQLYDLMLKTSESLVQRRQTMNAFFITAIGSLLAIAGALEKFGTNPSQVVSFLMISSIGTAGILLCRSWRNLIVNYGKLNEAKFRVILKLEEMLPAQIFAAEWAALGKGRRPKKYQSFTTTECQVPQWFAALMFFMVMTASTWRLWDSIVPFVNKQPLAPEINLQKATLPKRRDQTPTEPSRRAHASPENLRSISKPHVAKE